MKRITLLITLILLMAAPVAGADAFCMKKGADAVIIMSNTGCAAYVEPIAAKGSATGIYLLADAQAQRRMSHSTIAYNEKVLVEKREQTLRDIMKISAPQRTGNVTADLMNRVIFDRSQAELKKSYKRKFHKKVEERRKELDWNKRSRYR